MRGRGNRYAKLPFGIGASRTIRVGFIAYQLLGESSVRIFMECEDEPGAGAGAVSYTHAVDAQFIDEAPGCRLSGIDNILALKKFYKLAFSLEERARERGGDWRAVFDSRAKLVEHLDYTRNARRLAPGAQLRVRKASGDSMTCQQQQASQQ